MLNIIKENFISKCQCFCSFKIQFFKEDGNGLKNNVIKFNV